jgi:hypothetical protein
MEIVQDAVLAHFNGSLSTSTTTVTDFFRKSKFVMVTDDVPWPAFISPP